MIWYIGDDVMNTMLTMQRAGDRPVPCRTIAPFSPCSPARWYSTLLKLYSVWMRGHVRECMVKVKVGHDDMMMSVSWGNCRCDDS